MYVLMVNATDEATAKAIISPANRGTIPLKKPETPLSS
jgi:hypothetical protein